MRPYSLDLRRRVVAAYRRGEGSVRDLASEFEIAPRTLQNWLTLADATGSIVPRPHGGGRPARLTPGRLRVLQQLAVGDSDATLSQLAARLARTTGGHVHPTTISRALAELNLTRKKRRSTRPSATGRTFAESAVSSAAGSCASRATA